MSPKTNVNTEKKPAETPTKVSSAYLSLKDDYSMSWVFPARNHANRPFAGTQDHATLCFSGRIGSSRQDVSVFPICCT